MPPAEPSPAVSRPDFRFAWSCAATIFLGAFLLFQVQPVISKIILPWFGGGPNVWTTCMLFFQVLLVAGYAYSHFLIGGRSPRRQALIHIVVLLVASGLLPIVPSADWKPADGARPTFRILMLLLAHVGVPYFALATTGPLVQAWYSRRYPGRSPYRLYSLSNIGSLGALLTYPVLVEPIFATNTQGTIWSLAFVVYVALCAALAWATRDLSADATSAVEDDTDLRPVAPSSGATEAASLPKVEHRLAWVALPALGSMMLLAVTNHLCQDIAVVPFFWVVPLSLYLISFIICFDHERWYVRSVFAVGLTLAIAGISVLMLEEDVESWLAKAGATIDLSDYVGLLLVEAGIYLTMLFLLCMVCHGEVARLKPAPRHLTSFYLMISAGGALGGLFVGLVCPQVFPGYLELQIGLVAAFMLAVGVLADDWWLTWPLRRMVGKAVGFCLLFVALLLVVRAQFESLDSGAVVMLRNFYGVLSVKESGEQDPQLRTRELMNGRIMHGAQFLDPERRREATTYYNELSGVGLAIRRHSAQPKRVATVGLGTGTIASYAERGDYYAFYEINPNVPRIAWSQFFFLQDAQDRGATVEIKSGDARITLEREPSQAYDVIALDAFSGDAIPAHLLTREAMELYFRHLADGGVIAVHVSNRHLDLTPVVDGLAKHFQCPLVKIEEDVDLGPADATSDWMLLTRNAEFLIDDEVVNFQSVTATDADPVPLWTDQHSNLFRIMEKPAFLEAWLKRVWKMVDSW